MGRSGYGSRNFAFSWIGIKKGGFRPPLYDELINDRFSSSWQKYFVHLPQIFLHQAQSGYKQSKKTTVLQA